MPGDILPWVRLCDAVELLGELARITVARIELGELRHMETPWGTWVHIEDLQAIVREQRMCGYSCRGPRCLSSACTARRAAATFSTEAAISDARRLARATALVAPAVPSFGRAS